VIKEDREVFDQCTDTIIRQVEDIGRMVDEFSSFARMPKPEMKTSRPARGVARGVVPRRGQPFRHQVRAGFRRAAADGTFDSRLLAQAFGNIIKNASEAIDGRDNHSDPGVIRIQAKRDGNRIRVDVIDNGKGLPRENRQRLLEPYMTTREKGTGLGLAIVKKIIEDHGGSLELHDAPRIFP
jgi:two-component system nitrogen regulation sensor histidine kinase NtrY